MENCVSLGFPAVSSDQHLCPACWVTKAEVGTTVGVSALGFPWACKTMAEYDAACRACEHRVEITSKAQASALRANLENDRRPQGARGRALRADAPEHGLRIGYRLEPSNSHYDVCDIDVLEHGSFLFWSRREETLTRHRNPLFDAELGVTPDIIMISWLHTLSLGCFKLVLARIFWDMIGINAWGVPAGPEEAVLEASLTRMQGELFAWYGAEQRAGRMHSRVQRLPAGLFGTSHNPSFGFHGAETNGLLLFSGRCWTDLKLPCHKEADFAASGAPPTRCTA